MSPDAPEAPSSLEPDFGSMGIYVDGRTANELNELLKRKSASAITSRDLHALSCMHYLDDEPMREAAAHFRLADADANGGTPRTVLDFGAGYAGDARVLADEYPGVLVTCVEVQRHIHDAAARFTAMLASAHPSRGPPRCLHECLDILDDRAEKIENLGAKTHLAEPFYEEVFEVLSADVRAPAASLRAAVVGVVPGSPL